MRETVKRGDEGNRAGYGALLDDVYQKIKGMMYHNQLVPGQKIIYGDLARQLNTSITPVVQALKRLESSKIVEYFPNKGYFIMGLTETEVRELYEAREAIELSILPNIIKNITPEEINALREYVRGLHINDPRKWGIHDEQFHLAFAKYAKNDVIYHLLEQIFDRIYLRYKPQFLGEQRLKESLKEHRAIFAALANRNLKVLRNAIKKHIAHQLDYTIHNMLK